MSLTQSYGPQRDLLIGQLYKRSSTSVVSRSYSYDTLGRPVTRSTSKDGSTVNDTFGYNSRSELNTAMVNNEAYAYDYDNIGNRETAQEAAESATTYESNNLNQYTAIGDFEPTYDDAGNQTTVKTTTGIWSVIYNAENRPTSFTNADNGTIVECSYDYMGRRATKKVTVNGTVTLHQRFLYRGYLQIACCDLTRSHHPALWFITWDPTQPVATRPLAIQISGTWHTYGWDLTKNICELYGTTGYISTTYTYTLFGQVTASDSVTQPIQWSSEVRDEELGLMYYNWRYYNAMDGRWNGRDFFNEKKGGHNRYSTIRNSLISYDYLGLTLLTDRDYCISKYKPMVQLQRYYQYPQTLAEEKRVHTPHGGNYDLILKQDEKSNCTLIVFMRLQFYFLDNGEFKWNDEEKKQFIYNWKNNVRGVWEDKYILKAPKESCVCPFGIHVKLSFETQIDGYMYDHWEISVKKTNKFEQSGVYMRNDEASLDSQDLTYVQKDDVPNYQRGAIHEFGHMLGLLDEYPTKKSLIQFANDKASVMNHGESVRIRHYYYFQEWINNKLKKK